MPLKPILSTSKCKERPFFRIIETEWGFCAYTAIDNIVTRFFLPRPTQQAIADVLKNELPFLPAVAKSAYHSRLDKAVKRYFAGKSFTFDCRVDISWASPFGQKVLRCCTRIEPGKTLTYGRLAGHAGNPNASRAVGRILAGNPTPILIPCHRVIRADGAPGGYSGFGGTAMKNKLIAMEKSARHLIYSN